MKTGFNAEGQIIATLYSSYQPNAGIRAFIVLEIGTEGYQSMGSRKWVETLLKGKTMIITAIILRGKYPNIKYFYGDGYEGLPTYAPFDKIVVTAAAPSIPAKLIEQLKIGGYMVIPVGEGNVQKMLRIIKQAEGVTRQEVFDSFSFVPMIEGKNN
jgi:protein-L-isoaspartate(D-aspartate) O-methyltransferase